MLDIGVKPGDGVLTQLPALWELAGELEAVDRHAGQSGNLLHLSHAKKPAEELAALKRSIAELAAIGRNLNQIARTLNAGSRSDGPGRQGLDAMLKIAVALRDHVRALLKANETSWERGYGETTH